MEAYTLNAKIHEANYEDGAFMKCQFIQDENKN